MNEIDPRLAQVYDLLRSIMQLMDIHSRSLQKKKAVTAPQLSILSALADESPLNVSQLAKKVHLSIGTISGIIHRLEQNDFIQRIPSMDDKRKVFFRLAPKAATVFDNGSSLLSTVFIRNFVHGLPEWEKYMILSSLQRLNHLMQDEVQQSGI